MAICRFFQQGHCRYGKKCWNEHVDPDNRGIRQQLNFGQDHDSYSYNSRRGSAGTDSSYRGNRGGGQAQGGQRSNFGSSYDQNQNPYRWLAPGAQQGGGGGGGNQDSKSVAEMTPHEILPIIAGEIQLCEESNMWPLSCFAYGKEVRCFPGLDDHSPEELRHKAYEAEKSGSFEAYKQNLAQLVHNAKVKKLELQKPDHVARQKLSDIIETINRDSLAGNNTGNLGSLGFQPLGGTTAVTTASGGDQPAGSVFGGSQSTVTPSLLGTSLPGTGSVFGGSASTQSGSAFGSTAQTGLPFSGGGTSSGSVFGGSATGQPASVFSSSQTNQTSSVFGGSSTQSNSTVGGMQPSLGFGQAAAVNPAPSAFGNPLSGTTTTGLFGKGLSSAPPTSVATGLFGKPAAIDLSGSSVSSAVKNQAGSDKLYTPLDQLTKAERLQFEAPKFILGKIPIRPPPRELV